MMKIPSKESQKRRRSGRLATIKRTKENIVIFKVFINYKNKYISKETLIKQFSSFGKIKDFKVISQNEENTCKITYYDPMSAAHLLSSNFIRLNQYHIMVKPCPTWEQPLQVTSYNENEPSTSTEFNNPPQYTEDILKLNDYCLEMVFDYLDFRSQLRFSFCHERLENIFTNMVCPRLPQQLLIAQICSGKFSDWEIWQFFKNAGQYIKYIKITQTLNCNNMIVRKIGILNMINEFCTNAQRVQIINIFYIRLNFFNINTLTEIELYSCNIIDDDFEILLKCRNLISLGLAKNSKLIGDYLPSLKQLQHLSLFNCQKIKMINLIAACINMDLKYLDIRITNVDKTCRSEVLKYCTKLETLKMSISSSKDLKELSNLENLKSLEFTACYNITSSYLSTLFEKCNKNLETLKLIGIGHILPNNLARFSSLRTLWISMQGYGADPQIIQYISSLKQLEELYIKHIYIIDGTDLKSLIKNCLKLKRLCISECNIKPDFLHSCSEILQMRDYIAPTTTSAAATASFVKPLTIYLIDTCIKSSFIKSFNTSDRNKLIILKKISEAPLDGLLSDDLPFDVKDIVYDDRNDDDRSDTSDDESDLNDDFSMDGDEGNDDYNVLFDRPLCILM